MTNRAVQLLDTSTVSLLATHLPPAGAPGTWTTAPWWPWPSSWTTTSGDPAGRDGTDNCAQGTHPAGQDLAAGGVGSNKL